jgi:hypothetical protein
MTLIVTRTSVQYALMVTDRKLTRRVPKDGAVRVKEFDAYANKNVVFADRNAVVAIGYTGMAYIGSIPTDQWIAQTLTGLTFPEGWRGKGTVPALMIRDYAVQFFGVRVRNLRDRLNDARPLVLESYRDQWTADSFALVITGWEWNHGKFRPFLAGLSKPSNSNTFALSHFDRHWYLPRGRRFPVRMCVAPAVNLREGELGSIEARLNSLWGDGHGTPAEVVDHAEVLIAEMIQDISLSRRLELDVIGPDTMSIRIPPPVGAAPTIRIRYIPYIPEGRHKGVIVAGGRRTPVSVAFTPWVVSPGCIRSPVVFANLSVETACGPYQVLFEGPPAEGVPGVMSSQVRPRLEA